MTLRPEVDGEGAVKVMPTAYVNVNISTTTIKFIHAQNPRLWKLVCKCVCVRGGCVPAEINIHLSSSPTVTAHLMN